MNGGDAGHLKQLSHMAPTHPRVLEPVPQERHNTEYKQGQPVHSGLTTEHGHALISTALSKQACQLEW